jgi:hypothetical protein
VSPVKYEQGFYIPEDDIPHSHRRENLKSYIHLQQFSLLFVFTSSSVSIFLVLQHEMGGACSTKGEAESVYYCWKNKT